MKVRVGIEGGRRPVLERARALGAPILVSANSLWHNERQKFYGWKTYTTFDCALDCGGFVAMQRYGGYRWTVGQYVELAAAMRPTWFAQMDFCCEPEIATNRLSVASRIDQTVEMLHDCQDKAKAAGVARPMPVLQGWLPSDYTQGPIYDPGFEWPDIVGIGSVCRRQIHGPDGVVAVVTAIDKVVPPHVRFHLFGVKSGAASILCGLFPNRIESVDSMAWAKRCRTEAHLQGRRCDGNFRADHMAAWYLKQIDL